MNTPQPQQYLFIDRYHMNERVAEEFVLKYLRVLLPNRTDKFLRSNPLHLADSVTTLPALVNEARTRGCCESLWLYAEGSNEYYFPFSFAIAGGGAGLGVTMSAGKFTDSVTFPGRLGVVEYELADDILETRAELVAVAPTDKDYRKVGRLYRSYIFACTAIVEGFIGRHVHANQELYDRGDAKLRRIATPASFEERVEAWCEVFSDEPVGELKKTVGWAHFSELRVERNRLLHGLDPFSKIQLSELPDMLNKVREGVGGLMSKMRAMHSLGDLPFAQRLKTAPQVRYNDPSSK